MKDTLLSRIYVVFLAIFAIGVLVAIQSVRTINRSVVSSDWVNRTHGTIYELDRLLADLQAGEGMLRTYALTGEARDYAAADDAFSDLGDHLAVARALLHSDPEARASLDRLGEISQARSKLAGALRTAFVTNRPEDVRAMLQRDPDAAAPAEFKREIDRLRDRQFALLSERDQESFRQASTTRWIVGIGVGLNLVLFAGAAWFIRDDLAARRRLADTLREANEVLELRVRERTRELTEANRALTAENLERRWASLSQEHQLRYNQLIVNTVSDLVFVLTKALHVTRVNPAVLAELGFGESEILGRPVDHFLRTPTGGPGPNDVTDLLTHLLDSGREQTDTPAELVDSHGRTLAARLTVVPLRDKDKVVGAVVVLHRLPPAPGTPGHQPASAS